MSMGLNCQARAGLGFQLVALCFDEENAPYVLPCDLKNDFTPVRGIGVTPYRAMFR